MNASLKESNGLSPVYINKCLKRSQEALLDINLDFSSVYEGFEYLCSFYEEPIRDLPLNSMVSSQIEKLVQFLDYDNDPIWMGQVDKIGRLVRTIMAHKDRWRSVTVNFPAELDTKLAADLWVLFLGGGPPQTNLDRPIPGDTIQRAVQQVTSTFSAIENYTISGSFKRWMLSFCFGSLRELAFEASWMDPIIHSLSSCTDLQALTIAQSFQLSRDNPSRSPLVISLPSLTQLTLKGYINGLAGIEFQVPRLTNLTLASPYTAWQYLPRVRPRFVYWHVITDNHEFNLRLMTNAILRLLNEYRHSKLRTIRS
ncbi:hypothetical protein FRC20_008493 [Serendipita sp. 405]|nr:hypothetical protein FRC15_008460 [Serendipita sp. 397]KAG8777087.1 hypothetical protein FRC16_004289 [Serendipita sp. 398]KAG8830110.1 hypothetical protein FRC20_008493 [Serendipita sp. 405]